MSPKTKEQEALARKLNRVLSRWSISKTNTGMIYRLNRKECEVSAGGAPLVRVRCDAPQSPALEWNDSRATFLGVDKNAISADFLKDDRPSASVAWSRG